MHRRQPLDEWLAEYRDFPWRSVRRHTADVPMWLARMVGPQYTPVAMHRPLRTPVTYRPTGTDWTDLRVVAAQRSGRGDSPERALRDPFTAELP